MEDVWAFASLFSCKACRFSICCSFLFFSQQNSLTDFLGASLVLRKRTAPLCGTTGRQWRKRGTGRASGQVAINQRPLQPTRTLVCFSSSMNFSHAMPGVANLALLLSTMSSASLEPCRIEGKQVCGDGIGYFQGGSIKHILHQDSL